MFTRRRTKPGGSSEPPERQEGVMVPDPLRSPTCDGLSSSRAAGEEEEYATATAVDPFARSRRTTRTPPYEDPRRENSPMDSRRSAVGELNVIDISDYFILEGVMERREEVTAICAEAPNATPAHMSKPVEVQTPGGTSVGDIIISQEKTLSDLRMIADDLERELVEELNNSKKSASSDLANISRGKKGLQQKEKKRKREEDGEEKDNEENSKELSTKDGDKVFMSTRTGKAHYLQVIKEMECIKGVPVTSLIPKMIEWILACEIRRQKSKNINGYLARQMREYLIRLFCTANEVQKQKENTETGKLIVQMNEMKREMATLREENKKLSLELEHIKNSVKQTSLAKQNITEGKSQTNKEKERNIEKSKEKNATKENEELTSVETPRSPPLISAHKRAETLQSRRELRFPQAPRNSLSKRETPISKGQPQNKRKEIGSLNKRKKSVGRLNSINSTEQSARKEKDRRQTEVIVSEQPEQWSKVIGRKEKRQFKRREEAYNRKREEVSEKFRTRRPMKTSAVVITVGDQSSPYSEVLTWARQTVNLNDEEMKALTTKRSATGGILLEIRGENNRAMADRLRESLKGALKKFPSVKVHIPKQMAELTLVGLDISINRDEINTFPAAWGVYAPR